MTNPIDDRPFVAWSYVPEDLEELLTEWFAQLNEVHELDDSTKEVLENAEEAPFTLLASFLEIPLEVELKYGLETLLETVKTAHKDDSEIKRARIASLFKELFYGHVGRKTSLRMQEECDEYLTNVVFKLRAFRVSWQEIADVLEVSHSAIHQRFASKIAERMENIAIE